MCFSAEASFSLGTALLIIGALCLKKTKTLKYKLLALIPVLFGIQQLAEGFVWLYLTKTLSSEVVFYTAQTIFLVFAWMLWPIYSSIAVFISEKIVWRKVVCSLCFILGFLVLFVDAQYMLKEKVIATTIQHSIYYPPPPIYGDAIYLTAVVLPLLISSIKKMWIFGLAILISFVAAEWIWLATASSVWCFFAAISSLILLGILPRYPLSHNSE